MAESDTRLETLEDEVKVLKGEVKRTLVDLRALLMREDSPLGEGALTRRATTPAPSPDSLITPAEIPAPAPVPDPSPAPSMEIAAPGPGPGPEPGPPPGPQPALEDTFPPDPPVLDLEEDAFPDSEDALPEEAHEEAPEEDMMPEPPTPPSARTNGRKKSPRPPAAGKASLFPAANGTSIEEEDAPSSAARPAPVSSIDDEYRDLLAETQQSYALEDSPTGPPLDVNLLSNLVYWTALAKQRVGEEQLKDILQLYIQSGHSRPQLQDLLLHLSRMVDTDAMDLTESNGDWVDLMFHLHGILTGGFPVIKIPQVRLTRPDEDDGSQAGRS